MTEGRVLAQEQHSCDQLSADFQTTRQALIADSEWALRSAKILEAVRYIGELSGVGADKIDAIKQSLDDGNISLAQDTLESFNEGVGSAVEKLMGSTDELTGRLSETKKLIETGDKILNLALAAGGEDTQDPAALAKNFKSYFGLLTSHVPGGTSSIDDLIDGTDLEKEWNNFKKKPSLQSFRKVSAKAAEKTGQIADTFKSASSEAFVIGAFIEAYATAVNTAMDTIISISVLRQKQQSLLDDYFPELQGRTFLYIPSKKSESSVDRLYKKMTTLRKAFDDVPCDGEITDARKTADIGQCSYDAMVQSAETTYDLCTGDAPEVSSRIYRIITDTEKSIRDLGGSFGDVPEYLSENDKTKLVQLIKQRDAALKVRDARDKHIKACWAQARKHSFFGTLQKHSGDFHEGKLELKPQEKFDLNYTMCHLWTADDEIGRDTNHKYRTPRIVASKPIDWPVNPRERKPSVDYGVLYERSSPYQYSGTQQLEAPSQSGTYFVFVLDDQDVENEDTFVVARYEIVVAKPLEGLWKMGNTVIEIKQDGDQVTGTYKEFLAGSKYESRGRRIGENALRATRRSNSIVGTRWDSFEIKHKDNCGEQWSQWSEIQLAYDGKDTLSGKWGRQYAEIHSCRLTGKRPEPLELVRHQ